jgi:sRNA-binding protein
VSSTYQIERNRGSKEAKKQLAVLREKWPIAFPAEDESVLPLAIGAAGEIAAAMNWSVPYTLGVLARWKMAPAYCKAILSHDQRVGLDGSPAELVDADAKTLATKRLTAREAAKKSPNSKPAPPTETPAELRARIRASLLRRRT